ncbi:DJ-1/PfpI family protein [Vibrio sp. CAU 1672]|uniref:DJ-1/PfpI family protein n=1 Tax=Vibrio sp. CAU 1672 TaxID=3032594 RepID=UPI0023DC1163|nr:DJ-1/PfpI family protein [Vibrio sp. CAU 1672]MDF2154325.1 DJ-1/PfpI family protein [Vibrio sp. CAU 1672]
MNIGIYIYDNAEVLDFSGPFEVLSTAKRLGAENWHVFLIAEYTKPVVARGGYHVLPHYSIQHHPPIDVLLVAGGVHGGELAKSELSRWIRALEPTARIMASVCTGAFLLAQAGLLDGRSVTTHWQDIPELTSQFPGLNVVNNRRWIVDGKYITSGGISAGIDMSLYLVSILHSPALAGQVARQMEYRWQINPEA